LGNAVVAVSRSVVSGVDDPDVDGTVARLQGDLLSIAITQAALFIGSGVTLNEVAGSPGYGTVALPESDDPNAVGFSVSGGSLQLGVFTARDQAITGTTYTALTSTRKYTAVQGALGKAQLQGVDAVKLIGTSLVLQINRSSVASGGVLDWRQSSLSAAALSLSPSDPTFRIGGSVGLSIADLVYGSATISVSRTLVTGVTVTETSGVSTLKGDLFAIAISQAKLFIGSGASLDTNSSSTGFGS